MDIGGLLMITFLAINAVIGFLVIVFAIRLWGLITEADEFFARENQRYRREYEQRRHGHSPSRTGSSPSG